VSQITKILYRPECGLVMACFMGYVELFDSIEFKSKGTWDNQITVGPQKVRHLSKPSSQDFSNNFLLSYGKNSSAVVESVNLSSGQLNFSVAPSSSLR
jgi:hypothetical protein